VIAPILLGMGVNQSNRLSPQQDFGILEPQ